MLIWYYYYIIKNIKYNKWYNKWIYDFSKKNSIIQEWLGLELFYLSYIIYEYFCIAFFHYAPSQ